jgi:hypothetical protein
MLATGINESILVLAFPFDLDYCQVVVSQAAIVRTVYSTHRCDARPQVHASEPIGADKSAPVQREYH